MNFLAKFFLITFFLTVLFVEYSWAQNFQPVYTDTEYMFSDLGTNTNNWTVKANGDTLIVFDKVLRGETEEGTLCRLITAPYFGDSIVIQNDRTLFYTQTGDEFQVLHDLNLGDEWVLGKANDSLTLKAKVTSLSYGTFFSTEMEYAKVEVSKSSGSGEYEGLGSFFLGKGFGLVSIFDFLNPNNDFKNFSDQSLIGTSRGQLGSQHFGFLDSYSLPIGTIIHDRGITCGPNVNPCTTKRLRLEILDKIVYGNDSVYFKVDCYQVETSSDWETEESITTYDSFVYERTIINDGSDDRYQGEIYANGDHPSANYFRLDGSVKNEFGQVYWNGSCLSYLLDEFGASFRYKVLGAGVYSFYGDWAPYSSSTTSEYLPVYYNTGSEEWGTPIDVLTASHERYDELTNYSVYPTTSDDVFFIEIESGKEIQVELYSQLGVKLYSQPTIGAASIDILPDWNGTLFYKIIDSEGKVGTGQLHVAQ